MDAARERPAELDDVIAQNAPTLPEEAAPRIGSPDDLRRRGFFMSRIAGGLGGTRH
jgi:hypothetical protein